MAALARISISSVQNSLAARTVSSRIGYEHLLIRTPDPKLRDIVGLYIDPPAHAMVLSVDEKPQIRALDRTQPGLAADEPPPLRHSYSECD